MPDLALLSAAYLLALGAIYWVWVALKLGSLPMLLIGFAGPAVMATAPIGLYMLLFGVPDRLVETFGRRFFSFRLRF